MFGNSRIMNEGRLGLPKWVVYDKNFHEVIYSSTEVQDCVVFLEKEIKLERLACPTGGCED